jgi:hypothetical protein
MLSAARDKVSCFGLLSRRQTVLELRNSLDSAAES